MDNHWIDKYNQNQKEDSHKSDQDDFDMFMEMSEYDAEVDTDAAWEKFEKKIQKKNPFLSTLLRIAAVLVIGLAATFILIDQNSFTPNSSATVISATSKVKSYTLPDGSVVTLAPRSSISFFNSQFSSERDISLKGEAYFDITKSNHPFTIETALGEVKVLGTSFNLNVNQNLDLYVKSGVVQVRTEQEKIKVTRGQRAYTSKNGRLTLENFDGTNLLSWSTGHFKFENESLEEVIPYLEKYYEVKISASKALKNCKVTAEFNKMSLTEVVNVISTILNAKGEITDKKVKITGTGCD